ncbi:FkbM family methyltransferase [Pedobacter sp. MR22-3]|uniref:FkbM family methyltransferase n=1 Tax=Pedobacter sp. MR22-3 TaxID=2994552 RepID=UPI0022459AFB|nr:FkbM family methyltransferase [Pedobacter sp. MR22-3]MCX2585031.1 FkbM family methyltransferase [Pedobacter sp. MR22-3]
MRKEKMVKKSIHRLLRFILRRKLFKGQFRIFLSLFKRHILHGIITITRPLSGNFRLNVNTGNFIDAAIYFTGDYEPYLKKQYQKLINPGDYVMDIGANIGFHTMYFAELCGPDGIVFAFEPIQFNYDALLDNLSLNSFTQIRTVNAALGNENREMDIHIDPSAKNPGAYNLLSEGEKNTFITCLKGDDYLSSIALKNINFIKIDVEGYEYEVLKGLKQTILRFRPTIIFEYDRNYQLKMNADARLIFDFLKELKYNFYCVDGYGVRKPFTYNEHVQGAEIIALAN